MVVVVCVGVTVLMAVVSMCMAMGAAVLQMLVLGRGKPVSTGAH